ncbi:MAG: hypothetical protein WKF41_15970 [Gaiellaceae bacterium]
MLWLGFIGGVAIGAISAWSLADNSSSSSTCVFNENLQQYYDDNGNPCNP